jgi:SAM-dependent methyltransferase
VILIALFIVMENIKSTHEKLSSKRYKIPYIDMENKNNSQSLIVELTGRNKRILEIGTSSGYQSKLLKEWENSIIGIELDKEAGEIAKQFCNLMIIGDIENIDLDSYLELSSIDVIIFGDVLEHLKDPEHILEIVKKYLKKDGYLVISLPNVCHGDVLLNLLNGDFKYTSMGLLDATHLRFFGLKNIINLFKKCGYSIADLHTVIIPMGNTELKIESDKIPLGLFNFIKSLPNSNVYQFIFKAIPDKDLSIEIAPEASLIQLFAEATSTQKLEQEINEIQKNYKEALKRVLELDNIVRSREERIQYLEYELQSIQQSIIWLNVMIFQKLVEKLLPTGSKLRRLYDFVLLKIRKNIFQR